MLLTWRDEMPLAENIGLWVAAGLRWNVGTGFTAGEPYAIRAVVAAAGIEGSVGLELVGQRRGIVCEPGHHGGRYGSAWRDTRRR